MKLFSEKITKNILPEYDIINTLLLQSLNSVVQYRSSRPLRISGNNVLMKIINQLPFNLDDINNVLYENNTIHKVETYCKVIGLNTSRSYGEFKTNILFNGTPEFGSVVKSDINPVELMELVGDWVNIQPLKFKAHNSYSLEYPVFDGKTYGDEKGYVVWELDLSLLLIKYHMWMSDKGYMEDKSNADFLSTMVLPYTYESFINIVMVNKFIKYKEENRYRFPRELIDVSNRLKRVLAKQNSKVDRLRVPRSYKKVLSHIPTVTGSVSDLYKDHPQPPTPYVLYKRFLSKLTILNYLLNINYTRYDSINSVDNNSIRNMIRTLNNISGDITKNIPTIYHEVRADIYGILESLDIE